MPERNYIDILIRLVDSVKFQRDTERARRAIKGVGDETEKTAKKTRTSASSLVAFAGTTYAFHRAATGLIDMTEAAGAFGEQMNFTKVVFGDATAEVVKFAEASKFIGPTEALNAAAGFGVLFTKIGQTTGASAQMSTRLLQLAVDIRSLTDAPLPDTLAAIRSGLVGEMEPLRRYGILLNDATLRQTAMAMGLTKTTKQVLTPAQRTLAAYNEILRQGAIANGDAERTSGSLANQQLQLNAAWEKVRIQLGVQLLPILTDVVGLLRAGLDIIKPFTSNSWLFFGAILALTTAWTAYTVVMVAANIQLAMAAGLTWGMLLPIGLLTAALVAVGAAGFLLARNWETIWNTIVSIVDSAVSKLRDLLEMVPGPLRSLIGFGGDVLLGAQRAIAGNPVGMAGGGTVTSAGAVIVGERGPELLRLPRFAQVEPLDFSGRAAGTGGAAPTIILKVDGREIARATHKATADERARK